MNQIKNFLLELAYHEKASVEFFVKGVSLYIKVKNMSMVISQKLVKKHFPEANLFSVGEQETVFILF